jgi:hypothetical protein
MVTRGHYCSLYQVCRVGLDKRYEYLVRHLMPEYSGHIDDFWYV